MGIERATGQCPRCNFLVNLFSKLHVIFILLGIAFIFGRDKEEDQ